MPPQIHEGKGADVVDLATPVDFGILVFECAKCTGNTIVKSDAEIDNLLVNDIGSYSGKRWLGARGDTTSRLQIQATGAWKVTVGGLDLAALHNGDQEVAGSGDDVVLLRVAPDTVRFTNRGEGNFIVHLMTDSHGLGPDLVINEIGDYEGTVLFDVNGTDAGLVQITSDGDWTLIPRA